MTTNLKHSFNYEKIENDFSNANDMVNEDSVLFAVKTL